MKTKRFTLKLWGLIIPCLVVAVWQWAAEQGILPSYKLPAPAHLFKVLLDYAFGCYEITFWSGKLLKNFVVSFYRVLAGFALAASCGILLGLLSGRSGRIRQLVEPTIDALRAIPGIAWLPIAIVWFGIGERNTLFLISLAVFFPVYVNTSYGVLNISPLKIRAGQMLGTSRKNLFLKIILPAAFPSIFVGLRLGLGVSWAHLVLGEITGVPTGLGAVLTDARCEGHVDMVIVSMVVIAIAGKVSDQILVWLCRFFYPLKVGAKN